MTATTSPLLADIDRLARERDALEAQLRRARYGIDAVLQLLVARPELDDEPARDWLEAAS